MLYWHLFVQLRNYEETNLIEAIGPKRTGYPALISAEEHLTGRRKKQTALFRTLKYDYDTFIVS